MLNALGIGKREIEMSRQIMCVKNLKKLGDVVGISSRGRNGYKCCSLKIVSLGHVHNERKNMKFLYVKRSIGTYQQNNPSCIRSPYLFHQVFIVP